ncbi:unnamed protein product [Symbiodinium microadriaticum]|nr:unnamed protein product [Symbiodinium microadriaticum]
MAGIYSPTRQKDKLKMERNVNPLLVTIFVDCPHTFTVSSLSRLLMWCVKMLRSSHASKYVASSRCCADGGICLAKGAVDPSSSPPNSVQLYQEEVEQLEACSHYSSCVSRLVGKLMLLLEYFRPEEAIESRGYEILSDFLMRFACLGDEEKHLLIRYGSIYR